MGVRCSLAVVLICISLMANDVEHLSGCLVAILYLWRNIYATLCPFFNWVTCLFIVELLSRLIHLPQNWNQPFL